MAGALMPSTLMASVFMCDFCIDCENLIYNNLVPIYILHINIIIFSIINKLDMVHPRYLIYINA